MNKRQKEILQSQLNSEEAVLKNLQGIYKKALSDIDERIAALMGRTDTENLQSIVYQLNYQNALKTQINGILDNLASEQYTTIADYLAKCYEDGFVGTLYDLHGQGIPLIFPINQDLVVRAVQNEAPLVKTFYDYIGEDVALLKNSVRNNISRGMAQGLSYAEIARSIERGMIGDYSTVRGGALYDAYRIARTEGHRITNAATYHAALEIKKKGADIVKQWDAALDKRTRPHHTQLDGQIRELEELFEVAGRKALYPGSFGVAAEDINCRCVALVRARWALDEDELQTLKDRAEYFGLDKTESFEDFKKKYLTAAEESEKQWGAIYGDVNVDMKYINSKDYRDKYSTLTDIPEVNDSLYEISNAILKHCNGTEHEDLYLINADDGSVFAKVTDTPLNSGIVYSDEFRDKLKEAVEKSVSIIGVHNHPEGTPPSADDFRKAYDNGYLFGIIPGHNGQLYRYETPKEPISVELANTMAEDISFFYQQGIDIDRASKIVYDAYGLIYIIIEGSGL